MTAITRSELEVQVRRWFLADQLSGTELDQLHRAWQQHEQDPLYMNMLWRQFDPANRVAEGRAWWEERQNGAHGTVVPITPADVINMWLTHDPPPGAPRPRPWCPDELVGRWRLVAAGKSREPLDPPTAPREWTLQPDGRLDTVGDPGHQGWTWCAHREIDLDLWLYPPGYPLPRTWSILRFGGSEMRIYAADEKLGFMRWQRHP